MLFRSMDHADQSYELFWKQMLRWLVNSTPDPVTITSEKDTYLPGESVNLMAEIADKSFNRLNNATVVARLTDPEGNAETVPLDWSGSRDGAYQAQLTAGAEGTYTVEVQASQGEQDLGSYRAAFQVHDRPVEFYNASLNAGGLRTIADQTNGQYYPLSDLADVVEDAQYFDGESSFIEEKELWDVPILFMLLCAAFGVEWLWLKKKGLA